MWHHRMPQYFFLETAFLACFSYMSDFFCRTAVCALFDFGSTCVKHNQSLLSLRMNTYLTFLPPWPQPPSGHLHSYPSVPLWTQVAPSHTPLPSDRQGNVHTQPALMPEVSLTSGRPMLRPSNSRSCRQPWRMFRLDLHFLSFDMCRSLTNISS